MEEPECPAKPVNADGDLRGSHDLRREAALHSLLEGHTQVQAARIAGVSDRTVRRYLDDPAFRKALRAGRERTRLVQRNRSATLQASALDILDRLLESDSERVQLDAVKIAVSLSRVTEVEDLEERIADVEQQVLDDPTFEAPTLIAEP